VVFQTYKTGESDQGSLLSLKNVHNGAFYNASKLKTVDFGYDNAIATFDNPYGPYTGPGAIALAPNSIFNTTLGDFGDPSNPYS
jgi:hypothetical protein